MTDPRRFPLPPSATATGAEPVVATREAFGLLTSSLALVLAMVGGASAAEEVRQVPVAVTARGCEPMEITVPAGLVRFVITNKSTRALEWEILEGVMVVDERENIAPGFKSRLTTRLKPGTYAVTCGLLDNPRGRLVVIGETPSGAAAKPVAADLVGAVAEYRVGSHGDLAALAEAAERLRAADRADDRAGRISALVAARAAFLATAPVHALVGPSAGALAEDFAALDRALFTDPPAPIAERLDRLDTDRAAFAAALRPLVAPADGLVAGARTRAAAMVALSEAAPPTPTALATLEAERRAIERVVGLFAGHARQVDPAAVAALETALAGLGAALAAAPGPIGGFADATTLPPDRRAALIQATRALADRLTPLPGLLGL